MLKPSATPFLPSSAIQWAALLANLLLIVNFVVALLVPWVEADMEIANAWVPIYIPIEVSRERLILSAAGSHPYAQLGKASEDDRLFLLFLRACLQLGLVRCFSDICNIHKEKQKGNNHQGPPGGWPGGPTVQPGG